jgi:hypothetical protein
VQYEELTGTYVSSANRDKFCTKSRVFRILDVKLARQGAFRNGWWSPGFICLALPGYWPAEKAARLLEVLAAEETGAQGALLVIEAARTRVRPLP